MSNSSALRPSPIDIKSLLAEFDASGLHAAAFARSKGLPPWKLYGALQRRGGKGRARHVRARAEQPALLPVHIVESKPASERSGLELLLAGGHRLWIGPDFDAKLLRRVLEALATC
jgi:hypothetical protein